MDAGVSRADKLDLECWMEASSMGKPLYEKFGFESLFKLGFDTEKPDASDEWRKCAHEMTPPPIFAMWRPKQGSRKSEDGGEVRMPWDLAIEYRGESRQEGRGDITTHFPQQSLEDDVVGSQSTEITSSAEEKSEPASN